MEREAFIESLKYYLSDFSEDERNEILYDYEEHFRIGIENGKSDKELIQELGNPRDIANQYRASEQNSAEEWNIKGSSFFRHTFSGRNIFIATVIIFLNLMIVLPVFLSLWGVVLALSASAASIVLAGIVAVIGTIIQPIFPQFIKIPDIIPHLSVIFGGIGTIALGILSCIGMYYAVRFFVACTRKYVRWITELIKGEREV